MCNFYHLRHDCWNQIPDCLRTSPDLSWGVQTRKGTGHVRTLVPLVLSEDWPLTLRQGTHGGHHRADSGPLRPTIPTFPDLPHTCEEGRSQSSRTSLKFLTASWSLSDKQNTCHFTVADWCVSGDLNQLESESQRTRLGLWEDQTRTQAGWEDQTRTHLGFVYYESLKRELKTKTISEFRCDERLKN